MADATRTDFHLMVAGHNLAVHVPDPDWLPDLWERYGAFIADADWNAASIGVWQVQLLHAPDTVDAELSWIRHDGQRSEFQVHAYRGWIDLDARGAAITTPNRERMFSALERILTYVLMQALPRSGEGLLLHGVGVAWDGWGHVFCGASGRGKTTVAALARERGRVVLSDETIILRRQDDGAWRVYSTPFWGQSTPPELVHRLRADAPLRAVYVLHHAPDFAAERLQPARAVRELLMTEKVAIERVASAEAWLAVAGLLVSNIPIYRLGFRPTPDLWEALAALHESGP